MKNINFLRKLAVVGFILIGINMNAKNTWYTYLSGNWDDSNVWTINSGGSVLEKPGGGVMFPQEGDDIVILSTNNVNLNISPATLLTFASIEVRGTLVVKNESNNVSFSQIKGGGSIYLSSDNFPATMVGAADAFTGTLVITGNDFNLTKPSSIYHMSIEMNEQQTVTLKSNLTLNGNLSVQSGYLQINGSSSLSVVVNGDVMVANSSSPNDLTGITTGGTAYHWLDVYGDFKNYGTINFANAPQYNTQSAGAVRLRFLGTKAVSDFICGGPTKLYRLFVNKGTNQNPMVNITQTGAGTFSLFAPANGNIGSDDAGTAGYEKLPVVLQNGTLKLGLGIDIGRLAAIDAAAAPTGVSSINDFYIPASARLWINGAIITASNYAGTGTYGHGVSVDGRLQITTGSLTIPANTPGLTYSYGGAVANTIVEGGTLNTPQIKPFNVATSEFAFQLTSGAVNFNVLAYPANVNPVLWMPKSSHAFVMTGGVMSFDNSNQNATTPVSINVQSAAPNVTGGVLNINLPSLGNPTRTFGINSSVPFFHVNLVASGRAGTNSSVTLNSALTVKGNLALGSTTSLTATSQELTVFGNFTLNSSSAFTQNTSGKLIFAGTGPSDLTNNATAITVRGFEVNKTNPENLVTLNGSVNAMTVAGHLSLISGALDLNVTNLTVNGGNVTATNSEGFKRTTDSGFLTLTGAATSITGSSFSNQNFGIVVVNKTGTLTLGSNIKLYKITLSSTTLIDLGYYNLTANNTATPMQSIVLTGGSASKMFRTNGVPACGGLTMPLVINKPAAGEQVGLYTVPVGTSTGYSPVQIDVTGFINYQGMMTIKPIKGEHPSLDGQGQRLAYYWQISQIPNDGYNALLASQLRYRFTAPVGVGGSVQYVMIYENTEWTRIDKAESFIQEYSGPTRTVFYNKSYYTPVSGFTGTSGDFTCGQNVNSSDVKVFYSRTSGNFNVASTWSEVSHSSSTIATRAPLPQDICIIGGSGSTNHLITASSKIDVSQIEIRGLNEVTTGAITPPTLFIANSLTNFGHVANVLLGKGKLVYEDNDATLNNVLSLNSDLNTFLLNNEAIVEYSGTGSYTLPTTTQYSVYPNLHIKGSGIKTAGNINIETKGGLEVGGIATFRTSAGANGDFNILGSINVTDNGVLELNRTTGHSLSVGGNIETNLSGTVRVQTGGTSGIVHPITLSGGIAQNGGTINLYEADNQNRNKASINFIGGSNVTVTNALGGTAIFYQLSLNKTAKANSVTFNGAMTLSSQANLSTKPLDLVVGTCILNNVGINNLVLSSGGGDFVIPENAILTINNGASATVTGDNTGIDLQGRLDIANNGALNCNGGTNNYIVYRGTGAAMVTVGGINGAATIPSLPGTLVVGSHFMPAGESDVLKFYAYNSASKLQFGSKQASRSDRGVFEIRKNAGSVLTLNGVTLEVSAQQVGATVPALYIDPETRTFTSSPKFQIGGGTVSGQTIDVFVGSTITPSGFEVMSGWSARQQSALTVNGILRVNDLASFNANGKDLTIDGGGLSFDILGTFVANSNTTYFGTANQSMSGTNTFYNLIKAGGNMTLNNSITVLNTFENNGTGTWALVANSLFCKGDVTNKGSITASSGYLRFDGSQLQNFKGAGTVSRLEIANNNVVKLEDGKMLMITGMLQMSGGILDIGSNQLTLTSGALTVAGVPFSATNMVRTNGGEGDLGIKKISTLNQTVIYPVGSGTKFTPVTFTVSLTTGTDPNRYIQIVPVNTYLSSAIAPADKVLQHHWIVKSAGITAFKGTIAMTYADGDALGSAEDLALYQTVFVDNNGIFRKNSGTVNTSTRLLSFDLTGTAIYTSNYIAGYYTAGVPDAYPNVIDSYVTVADGDWTALATWAKYTLNEVTGIWEVGTAGDVNEIPAGPSGNIVFIRHNVTRSTNNLSAFRTNLLKDGELLSDGQPNNGVLDIGTTYNHRMGEVLGTGKLIISANTTGKLPGGNFGDFFSSIGGTVEIVGTSSVNPTYLPLGNYKYVNNLILSGSGRRDFIRDDDFTINGDFTMSPSAALTIYNGGNKTITFKKNVQIGTNGSFSSGTGKVVMNGDALQTIGGVPTGFTQSNFEIKNASGVLSNFTELTINNNLNLVEGNLKTTGNNAIKVTNSSATGAITVDPYNMPFVDGTLRWNLTSGETYNFPVGDGSRSGTIQVYNTSPNGYWDVFYKSTIPPNSGESAMTSPLSYVSDNEYWSVKSAVASTARIKLRWDNQSKVVMGANLSLARFNSVTNKWEEVIGDAADAGSTNSEGSISSTAVLNFNVSPFTNLVTFGSKGYPPFTWLGSLGSDTNWSTTSNWSTNVVPNGNDETRIFRLAGRTQPVIKSSEAVQTAKLTIQSAAMLGLQNGAHFTVNGDFVNDGLLEMNSSTSSMSSFKSTGNDSGSGNVKVNMSFPSGQYWYHTVPVSGQTASSYTNFDTNVFLYKYDKGTGKWVEVTSGSEDIPSNPMRGYTAYFLNNSNLSFTGQSNKAASYSYTNSTASWDLVANPYLSYLDLRTGIDYTNVYRTVYIYTTNNGVRQFATYNTAVDDASAGAQGGSRYVAPMQAIWIRWFVPGANFTINKTSQTHSSNTFKSANLSPNDVLRLSFGDMELRDETVVAFKSYGSDNYSLVYDSDKRMETTASSVNLYSVKQSKNLVINSLPEDPTTRIVPLGIFVGASRAGKLSVKATNIATFMPDMDVILLDKVTGVITSLRRNPEYTFTSSAVNNQNRFELSFKPLVDVPDVPTGTETAKGDNIVITAIGIGNKSIVKVKDPLFAGKVSIEVVDALGRVHSSVLSNTERTEVSAPTNTQFYVVKVTYKDMVKSFKVMNVMN